ncbi:MAG TPA: sulfite exporter TauE/SafE family protein, partial [Gemmatimonadaceae bacterium]|nr:sulfite exporter TauE/SafE family protein [Gemmatimonadaceae bacterium]
GGTVEADAAADPPGDPSSGAPDYDAEGDAERTRHFPPPGVLLFQLLVSVYGGYFGAGIGILMLAALGFMGLTNIHRMNGLKNWGGLCANAVAAGIFAFSGIVNWPVALAMAVGGLLGGYGGSRMAQRVGQRPVRRAIAVIGLASFVWLLFRPM